MSSTLVSACPVISCTDKIKLMSTIGVHASGSFLLHSRSNDSTWPGAKLSFHSSTRSTIASRNFSKRPWRCSNSSAFSNATLVPDPRVCDATCVWLARKLSNTSGGSVSVSFALGGRNTRLSASPPGSAGMSSTEAYGPATTQSTRRCSKSPSKLSSAKSCCFRSSGVGSAYSST